MDRAHILAEIRRLAEANGGVPVGRTRFAAQTGIKESDWLGHHWARWSDALADAGFSPNQMMRRLDDIETLSKLIPEIRRLGRLPTDAERRMARKVDSTFPSHGVFSRFGSKQELIQRLIEFCDRDPSAYADVTEILQGLLSATHGAAASVEHVGNDDASWGFVYLLRVGKNYKIGRTNAIDRREKELSIQLPERAERVHVISTDDPTGIEGYWHRRFHSKRLNGEWFALDSSDVRAFKRRKFM